MTITCPSCRATYRIDMSALGEGRTVRCSRCRSEWFEPGTGAAASGDVDPILGLEDADAVDRNDPLLAPDALLADVLPRRDSSSPRRGRPARERSPKAARAVLRPKLLRRALASVRPVALVAGTAVAVLGATVANRIDIVRAAPSLASLYAAVGLPVNVRGLAIDQIKSVEEIDEGVPLLLVTGAVANLSGAELDVPRLRLAVTGGGGQELYAWTTVASRAKLAPGETAPFRARLASPPADGRGVEVRFLARQDLAARLGR